VVAGGTHVGVASGNTEDLATKGGFLQGLAEQGYVERRNVEVPYRSQHDRLPDLAADLVNRSAPMVIWSELEQICER
jgi:hypothetical protein